MALLNKKQQEQDKNKAQFHRKKVVNKICQEKFPRIEEAYIIHIEDTRVEVFLSKYRYTDWISLPNVVPPFKYDVSNLLIPIKSNLLNA